MLHHLTLWTLYVRPQLGSAADGMAKPIPVSEELRGVRPYKDWGGRGQEEQALLIHSRKLWILATACFSQLIYSSWERAFNFIYLFFMYLFFLLTPSFSDLLSQERMWARAHQGCWAAVWSTLIGSLGSLEINQNCNLLSELSINHSIWSLAPPVSASVNNTNTRGNELHGL